MIRASDLQGAMVRTRSGEKLGRVRELHLRDGEVISVVVGAIGMLQRFLPTRRGKRIAWEKVVSLAAKEIVVGD